MLQQPKQYTVIDDALKRCSGLERDTEDLSKNMATKIRPFH